MDALTDIRDMMRGALASLLGFGGRLAARVVFMILAGRAYGVEAIGILGQVAAITEIAAAIGVLGLKRSLLDMLSEKHENGHPVEPRVVEALVFSLVFGIIISVLLLFVWPHIIPGRPDVWGLLFFAVIASILADVALTAIKFKRIVRWDVWARSIGESWGILAFALVFLSMGKMGAGLLLAYSCSLFVVFGISIWGLFSTYGFGALATAHPSLKNIVKIPVKSTPVAVTDIGIMALRRVDLIVVGLVLGPAGAGLYYIVQQLATIQLRLAGLFEPMLVPVIARLHNRMDAGRIGAILISICRWIFIIQLAILMPMVVFGDYIMSIFNPAFMVGGTVLAIVLVAELIDGSFISVETPLVFTNPKIPPTLMALAIGIEIVLIGIFSKLWGVEGAALGFFVAILFLNVGRLVSLSKCLKIKVLNISYIQPLLFSLLMLACLYALRICVPIEQSWIIGVGVVLSLGGYAFLIKTFGLTKSDKILLRAIQRKRKNRAKRAGAN